MSVGQMPQAATISREPMPWDGNGFEAQIIWAAIDNSEHGFGPGKHG